LAGFTNRSISLAMRCDGKTPPAALAADLAHALVENGLGDLFDEVADQTHAPINLRPVSRLSFRRSAS
jgi:hypothetical protein